jgi:Flp pilus assembly protein TadD
MKKAKRRGRTKVGKGAAATPKDKAQPARAEPKLKAWHVLAGVLLAAVVAFEVYQPAINGPFLFDDNYLPFTHPDYKDYPLRAWLIGARPMLMLTYWVNYQSAGAEPYSYHLLNLLFHLGSSILVFFIVRKLLEWTGTGSWPREPVAAFAGGLFLLHPLNTEAVAYVASRSENLSVFLFYAAFAVFLYRRSAAISFPRAAAVLALFGAAVTSKEHTAVLPALLLLTDYYWNPGFSFRGIARNWRLYIPIAAAGAAGGAFIWRILGESDTAGFAVEGLPWYQYFFTQCKAIWIYVRMFVFPYGQNVDHDFPMAASLTDPGAIAGLVGLVAVAGAAWWYRRRYPLISFGIFVFLLLLAPTSSFVPIKDALVERRAYLPAIGLLLVAAGLLRRWKASRATLAGALTAGLVVAGVLGYQRNLAWAGPVALWEDAVAKSPGNARARFQLAFAYFDAQRCSDAVAEYANTAALKEPDYDLLVDWALACDCAGRPADALAKLEQAAAQEKTAHVYSLIGMMHGKQGQREEALAALATAEKIRPRFAMTYVYRGNVYATAGEDARAAAEYRRAIKLNPSLEVAHRGLQAAERRLGRKR